MRAVFVFASFLATAIAGVPPNAQWYTLSTKSNVNTLNNLYLSAKNGKVAAYSGSRESANNAGKFFTTDYSAASTLSFHAGDDSHQLGLSGKNGLLNLVDLINPRGDKLDASTPTMWSVFQLDGNSLIVKDGSKIPSRTWVTYLDTDGVYYVGLWDGVTPQPRTVANITITATKAKGP